MSSSTAEAHAAELRDLTARVLGVPLESVTKYAIVAVTDGVVSAHSNEHDDNVLATMLEAAAGGLRARWRQ